MSIGATIEIPVVKVAGQGDFEEITLEKGVYVLKPNSTNFNIVVSLTKGGDFKYAQHTREIYLCAKENSAVFQLQAVTTQSNPPSTVQAIYSDCVGGMPFFLT